MICARRRIDYVAQRAILAQPSLCPPCSYRRFLSTSSVSLSRRGRPKRVRPDDGIASGPGPSNGLNRDSEADSPSRSKPHATLQNPDNTNSHEAMSAWTSLKERLQMPDNNVAKLQEDVVDGHDGSIKVSKPTSKPTKSSKKKRRDRETNLEVKVLSPKDIPFTPLETERVETAELAHGLDKVLFNAGVYQLQDKRSKVYNFDPYLTSIMPIEQFDFDALKEYITSSKDVKLREMSAAHGLKYCGSTSSMTSILSHFHFLLSAWRKPSFANLTKNMDPESENYTLLSRAPAAAYARLKDGVYAIDSDKEFDKDNVLSMLGRSMEKLLTLPKDEFEKYRRTRSHLLTEEERNADEAFHYTTLGDFLMRSQLDAYDPRLPGTGVFDLKTRAVVSVRMDVQEYEAGRGYEIRERFGQWESFEREYHDMIRAAFLKYSLQVRMGRMDGVFVAYHNTQRIFGFHYIPLEEMDKAIHGTENRNLGDQEFKSSVALLNDLLDRAVAKFPGRSLRLHVETRPTKIPLTYFFVEPVTDEDMKKSEEVIKRSAVEYAEEIKDRGQKEREAIELSQQEQESQPEVDVITEGSQTFIDEQKAKAQNEDAWEALMAKVEETVETESMGKDLVREAVYDALEHGSLLRDITTEESEQYLDALVEALTEVSPGTKEIEEAAETGSEYTMSAPEEGPKLGEIETDLTTQQGVQTAEKVDTTTTKSPNPSTLRDLILQVTRGIEDKKASEMRAFERIIAERAAHTKQTEAQPSTSTEVAPESASSKDTSEATQGHGESTDKPEKKELLGMYVTIRNQVNGQWVDRPMDPREKNFDWTVQYAVTELPEEEASKLYAKIKRRRYTVLAQPKSAPKYRDYFRKVLTNLSKKGEQYRKDLDEEQEGKSVYVAWDKTPLGTGQNSSPASEKDEPDQKSS